MNSSLIAGGKIEAKPFAAEEDAEPFQEKKDGLRGSLE